MASLAAGNGRICRLIDRARRQTSDLRLADAVGTAVAVGQTEQTNQPAKRSANMNIVASSEATKTATVLGQNQNIDKHGFLKLMVAQLKHQDPLAPVDGETFMNQLVQLTNMEEMQNMSRAIESMTNSTRLSSAANLLGRQVNYLHPETGEYSEGIAERLHAVKDKLYLVVNGTSVAIESIRSVSDTPTSLTVQ